MKKSIISAIGLTAILSVCPILQSCSDTSSQTTYTTGYRYSSEPGYYSPSETTTTTTTTTNEPDGVVGSTGNAVGAIVAAPFEIVGDTLDAIF
jgi:ABC-type oligopeptide transport system substrate-binding subunit